MKTLVVFYSRTGTTKKAAEIICRQISGELEEIFDTQDRQGVMGYIKSGRDATQKRLTELKEIKNQPKDYDLVIIGTPIWAWTMSTPIRTYLSNYGAQFNKVAFFCTQGGNGGQKTFNEMEKFCGHKSLATLELLTKEVLKDDINAKVGQFVSKLN